MPQLNIHSVSYVKIPILIVIAILLALIFLFRSNNMAAVRLTLTRMSSTDSKDNATSTANIFPNSQCTTDPNWIYNMHEWTNKKGPHSQGSQDLYLNKIFEVISSTNKYFVEFGFNIPDYRAKGSGSNTYNLYIKGWRGLLLDGHHQNDKINLQRRYLFANNIASIFAENKVPKELDFLSCDMDSHDLWVFRSILQAGYRPRIITTEFNSNYHITDALTLLDPTINCSTSALKDFHFRFKGCAWGASAGALRMVAEAHGYTLIGRVDTLDLIWIRTH